MLEEKTHTITCRLDEVDFQKLKKEFDSLGVNTSDFVRLIVGLPIEYVCAPGQERIIVIDPLELGSLACIVRKQGYLFNQAVHALNTIAQKIRNGSAMNQELMKKLDKANEILDRATERHEDIAAELEDVQERQLVFLDRYRRNPNRRKRKQSPPITSATESH